MSKFNKTDNRGRRKNQGNHSRSYNVGGQAKEALEKVDENSTTVQNFKKYAAELDKKHDKYERIVKLSRDITIESKRIIFLLHSIDRESKKSSILNEAETRLEALVSQQWRAVAKELYNEDPYLFHRAFSPGMQEFMEAFIFFTYLKSEIFLHWDHYREKLKFNLTSPDSSSESRVEEASMILIPGDYILGLADVTGELMRKCINNLGEGNVEGCFKTCSFVRKLYSGFLMIGLFGNKEMYHKAFTLRQSLLKMEMVCYNIHVRGTETPKYMLVDIDSHKTYADEDEGFFS